MIAFPGERGSPAWNTMAQFIFDATGAPPQASTRYVGWVEDNKLKMVVAIDSLIGRMCQMHVAMARGFNYTPRAMLYSGFEAAFSRCDFVFGIVNSLNRRAMKYDLHLGFKEIARIPGVHENGGDVVMMGMWRNECRYLQGQLHRQEKTDERPSVH